MDLVHASALEKPDMSITRRSQGDQQNEFSSNWRSWITKKCEF